MDYEALPPVDLMLLDHGGRGGAAAAGGAGRRQGAQARRGRAESREVPAVRRTPAGRRPRPRAQVRGRRARGDADPPAAVLERRHLAVPPSARLYRLGGRRRRRRRARQFGRRGARAQGHGPAADRDLRRRRLLHGRHRDLDRGALPHSAAGGGLQQSLVLQRRAASGAGRAHPQPAAGEPLDRPAHLRSGHRLLGARARARRGRLRPGHQAARSRRRPSRRRSPRSRTARWRWSTCGSSPAIRRWRLPR